MTIQFTADTVTFDADEFGWEMVVEDDEGMTHRINIHRCAIDMLREAQATIGRYAAEAEQARATMPVPSDPDEPRRTPLLDAILGACMDDHEARRRGL